jgi:hypothetical protein
MLLVCVSKMDTDRMSYPFPSRRDLTRISVAYSYSPSVEPGDIASDRCALISKMRKLLQMKYLGFRREKLRFYRKPILNVPLCKLFTERYNGCLFISCLLHGESSVGAWEG